MATMAAEKKAAGFGINPNEEFCIGILCHFDR
jgi:hypothetical protein